MNISIKDFTQYFLSNVKVLRVIVPVDTDLNHYFEIMNSRGEQLEKHEILKAKFLNAFIQDSKEGKIFAKIWDACSNMDKYLQYNIDVNLRNNIFNSQWNELEVNSFDDIKNGISIDDNKNVKNSLEMIIASSEKSYKDDNSNRNYEESNDLPFNSIINFSNFLLHVLRIQMYEETKELMIPLDDKQLLEVFSNVKYVGSKKEFAERFAFNLLKYRFLFDKYIIKREIKDDKWSLKTLYKYQSNNVSYINAFERDKDKSDKNRQILMLLSMFHVSYPTLIYKHWLSAVLLFLGKYPNEIQPDDYILFLESLSDAFFYDRFCSSPQNYSNIIFTNNCMPQNTEIEERNLHCGTQVHNFIFNRLDYLLWKQPDSVYKKFDFTFRSSVEHYYPQNPIDGNKLDKYNVDRFGNLCLIASGNNSRLSNHLPEAKKEYYSKSLSVESIKQQIMMSKKGWDNKHIDIIKEHEQVMIDLLKSKAL